MISQQYDCQCLELQYLSPANCSYSSRVSTLPSLLYSLPPSSANCRALRLCRLGTLECTMYLCQSFHMGAIFPRFPSVFNVLTGTGPDAGAPLSKHPGMYVVSPRNTRAGAYIFPRHAPRRVQDHLHGQCQHGCQVFSDSFSWCEVFPFLMGFFVRMPSLELWASAPVIFGKYLLNSVASLR